MTGPSPILAAAAREDYNECAVALARRMRHFLHACEKCGSPIYEHPGHCVQCAWDGDLR